jgi:hypothetical protein
LFRGAFEWNRLGRSGLAKNKRPYATTLLPVIPSTNHECFFEGLPHFMQSM